VPILVRTADISEDANQRALSMGAKDFLTKPFHPAEILLRIKNLLETRFLYRQLQNQNEVLDEKVRERTQALEAAQNEILARLAQATEYRDDNTGQHTQRVGKHRQGGRFVRRLQLIWVDGKYGGQLVEWEEKACS